MSLLSVVAGSAVVLLAAYFTYGRFLGRFLQLDATRPTPAVELRDGIDYDPIEPKFLLSQHFSAIAAAGPIVGPILAGMYFGWLPALLWILIGSIFIGGVHDMMALVASIRHKARSIAEVVRDHMSPLSYILFLLFIWIALVYIIVAFTDITASAFVGGPEELRLKTAAAVDVAAADVAKISESGGVTGGAIASSSLLYLVLPIVMGLLLRYTGLSLGWATLIFVPLVGVVIWIGQYMPFDVGLIIQHFKPELSLAEADYSAQKFWNVALLAYCLIAGVLPVWLLLQPRGHLGGYFLYIALAVGAIGVVVGSVLDRYNHQHNFDIQYTAFKGWDALGKNGETLLPFLFITIACGACSGFHSMIASGTTSKQLRHETDARVIGYGAMLLEAMVAVFALTCLMILKPDHALASQAPNKVYAGGLGEYLGVLRVNKGFAIAFGLMAFTTFVYDTLDVCTRLGRYIVQELTGLQNRFGRWLGSALTAGVPLYFLLRTSVDANGKPIPAWQTFWSLFGATNQLLAALTLLGVTVWLWRTRGNPIIWLITGIPTVLMYVMSIWALGKMTLPKFYSGGHFAAPGDPVPWVGLLLIALAALMLVEAVRAILGPQSPPSPMKPALAS
ncbi:MAG: carbon starvation CstA family protein [Pirellulales bacterium]